MRNRSDVAAGQAPEPGAHAHHGFDAERVAAVRDRLPDDNAVEAAGETFRLLSDPGRLRLLLALLDGEMCVCDLALVSQQSESSVSHALRLLRAHRIVTVRRSGRRAFYGLADSHVRMLLDLALVHHEHTGPLVELPGGKSTR